MLSRIRGRLTYANVVASMALFIALGGVSYAAVKLPKNSVGPAQIKKNAVTGSKVKNSSLTGADVKNGSLSAADFKGSLQGLQGPVGAQGATGAKGESGTPGRSALTPLQTGESVTGGYYISMPAGGGGTWVSSAIPFPAAPKDIVIREVQDGPKAHCPGDVAAPRADPGYVCVYEKNTTASLAGSDLFQATYDADAGRTRGFALYTTSAGNTYGVWAYTAG